jgi:hypothetical protein
MGNRTMAIERTGTDVVAKKRPTCSPCIGPFLLEVTARQFPKKRTRNRLGAELQVTGAFSEMLANSVVWTTKENSVPLLAQYTVHPGELIVDSFESDLLTPEVTFEPANSLL